MTHDPLSLHPRTYFCSNWAHIPTREIISADDLLCSNFQLTVKIKVDFFKLGQFFFAILDIVREVLETRAELRRVLGDEVDEDDEHQKSAEDDDKPETS